MDVMTPATLRCPHCRKKQPEPWPKRCGCGQSLLALVATFRDATGTRQSPASHQRDEHTSSVAPELAGADAEWPTAPTERVDNDW